MLSKHGKSFAFAEAFIPKLEGLGYDVKLASTKNNQLLRLLDMTWALLSSVFKSKLIIVDSYSTKAFMYSVLTAVIAKLTSKKYICVLHGGDFPSRLERSPRLCNFVFNNSTINISPSKYLEHHFSSKGYKVKYIPNFINIDQYTFIKRKIDSPKLLWVRSFHKTYNPMLGPKILHELKSTHPDTKLCMVGGVADSTYDKTVLLAKELGVTDRIEFTGRLHKKEWRDKSKYFNIFINTTNYDNQPVSVVEAMGLGLPVISTNVGGLKYLIENGKDGILLEPDDEKAFAQAIDNLANNPELVEKITANARKKVEYFDWQKVKLEWLEVLKHAL